MSTSSGLKPSRSSHYGTNRQVRPPHRAVRPGTDRVALRLEGTATPVRLDLSSDWRSTLTAIGGVAATVGSLVTILVAIAALVYTNKNNADQQRANRDQLALSRQAQITDRFTRAVEQLGDHNVDVRTGGIYSLERIMRDSAEDHSTVFDILTTFVRVHAPADPGTAGPYRTTTTADALAAITVLGRRDVAHDQADDLIDLPRTNLSGARLHRAHLARAHLADGTIVGADLSGADLSGADLHGTDLSGSDLRGTDLSGADLRGTGVTDRMIRCARVDARTSLPVGVTRPAVDAPDTPTCTPSTTDSAAPRIP